MGTSARKPRDEWVLTTLEGLLTPDQFSQLKASREESYWEAATRRGWTTDDLILAALSKRFRMKIANLSLVSQQAKELVPEQLVRKYRVLPLQISDSILDIATADPHDLDCERTLAFALGRTVRMSLASPTRILARLDEVYRPENVIEKILEERFTGDDDLESISESVTRRSSSSARARRPTAHHPARGPDRGRRPSSRARATSTSSPRKTGMPCATASTACSEDDCCPRRALGMPLVSRVKIMAQLDIADRLRPQDGRARVAVSGSRVDLRVSTLPASHGEKVVIRILDQRSTVLSLDGLGLNPDEARAHQCAAASARRHDPGHRARRARARRRRCTRCSARSRSAA